MGGEPIPGIIEATKLVKKFGGITAVDGITFSVHKGEVFGFSARMVPVKLRP
jgi:ABC-type multidrug transport system ATPase subunit